MVEEAAILSHLLPLPLDKIIVKKVRCLDIILDHDGNYL